MGGEFRGGVAQVLVMHKVNYPMKIGYIDGQGLDLETSGLD